MLELVPYDYRNKRAIAYAPFAFGELFRFPAESASGNFRTDVVDNGDSFELDAELPGMNKENIRIRVDNDSLVITAEQKNENNVDRPNYVMHERFRRSCSRSFDMTGIDVDGIIASYENGILKVVLPKQVEQKTEGRTIEIA